MKVTSPTSWLPFAGLNLRFNPFGELTRSDRAVAAAVDVDGRADWLRGGQRRAVQFIGDCGRGKTTHLLALRAKLPGTTYVYLPQHGPVPEIPDEELLLIDEAQRFPWRSRRRLFARGPALALGTHNDLTRPLVRAGYAVQTVAVAAGTNAKQVRTIMNRRLELARLSAGPVSQLTVEDAAWLVSRFGNDLRAMEGYLYEQLQLQTGREHGEVRFVD